jgi:hypothetical protein
MQAVGRLCAFRGGGHVRQPAGGSFAQDDGGTRSPVRATHARATAAAGALEACFVTCCCARCGCAGFGAADGCKSALRTRQNASALAQQQPRAAQTADAPRNAPPRDCRETERARSFCHVRSRAPRFLTRCLLLRRPRTRQAHGATRTHLERAARSARASVSAAARRPPPPRWCLTGGAAAPPRRSRRWTRWQTRWRSARRRASHQRSSVGRATRRGGAGVYAHDCSRGAERSARTRRRCTSCASRARRRRRRR